MASQTVSQEYKIPTDLMDPRSSRTTVSISFDIDTDYMFETKDTREPFIVIGRDSEGEWVPISCVVGSFGWNITVPYINKVVTLKILY